LLTPLGAGALYPKEMIQGLFGLTNLPSLSQEHQALLSTSQINLILHPGSKGSAREWGLPNFSALVHILPAEKFRIFVTGSAAEGESMKDLFDAHPQLHNLCGKFSLDELIAFIAKADGLVAASTGPLHIAAALGRKVVGLYPPIRPMDPGRWAPIGPKVHTLVASHECSKCRKNGPCVCMQEITPEMVCNQLFTFFQ
jgi:heptosyltransferase-3